MDLTEHGGAKINKLGDVGLKNNFITASNGSLVSTGRLLLSQFTKQVFMTVIFIHKNRSNSIFAGSADSEMSEEQKKEKLSELRRKEQEIQDILAKKTKELKKICLREAVRNHFILHFFCPGALFCEARVSISFSTASLSLLY